MNKFAGLIAAGGVVAGGSTAAYSLVSAPSSALQARPALSALQSPRSGHTDDVVVTPDAHGRQQDSRKHTEPGDARGGRVGRAEPGDDHGNHAEPGDDRGNHAEPGDDRGNHAE